MKQTIRADRIAAALPRAHRFLMGKWFFDELYDTTAVRFTLWLSRVCAWFDRWIIDGLVDGSAKIIRLKSFIVGLVDNWIVDGAVNGVGLLTRAAGAGVRRVQGGDIQGYLVGGLVGVVVILIWQVL